MIRRLFPAGVAIALAACATQDPGTSTRQRGRGVEDYRQLAGDSTIAVLGALRSLEGVSAQADRCAPNIVDAFAEEVEQLQVKSLTVRARAQAIQARGDAYFEEWGRRGGEGQPSQPPEHVPELQESFARTKLVSQQAGESFRSFLSGLRTLRGDLMTDPGAIKTDKVRELIRTTREHGLSVLQKLGALTDELQILRRLLASGKSESNL